MDEYTSIIDLYEDNANCILDLTDGSTRPRDFTGLRYQSTESEEIIISC